MGNTQTTRKQLISELEILRTVLNSSPDLIYVKDKKGRFTFVNAAHAQYMGVKTTDELIGKSDFDFYPLKLASQYFEDEQAIMESGESLIDHEEPNINHRTGEMSWTSTTKMPLRDTNGEVIGIFGTSRDITILKEARKKLDEAYAEMERQVQERTTELRQTNEQLAQEIKERKLADEEIKNTHLRLNSTLNLLTTVFSAIPIPVFYKDKKGRYLGVNDAFADLLGFNPEYYKGKTVMELWPSEFAEVYHHKDLDLMDHPEKQVYEFKVLDKNEVVHPAIWSKHVFRDENGQVAGIVGAFQDITERLEAEKALRNSEEEKSLILNSTSDLVVYHNLDMKVLWANKMAGISVGEAPEELKGRNCYEIWHQRTESCEGCPVIQARETGQPHEAEIASPDGRQWFIRGYPIKNADREVIALAEFCLDITKRKRAEKVQAAIYRISEAAQTASSLDELYKSIHAIVGKLMPARNFYIALFDSATQILQFPYYIDKFDTTPSPGKLGSGLTDFVLRNGKPLLATPQVFEKLVQSGQVESRGAPSVDWLGVPLKTQRGETIGVMAVQTYAKDVRLGKTDQDILAFVSTQVAMAIERKKAEGALQESEERYRTLYEDNPSMFFTVDPAGNILSVNQFGCKQLGYIADELIDQSVLKIFHNKDKESAKRGVTLCSENLYQVFHWELRKVRKTGSVMWVKETARAIQRPDGQVVVYIVCEDITDRRQAEEEKEKLQSQLLQAQKMESIGQLAGGVAHDFNNMLGVILGHTELALMEIDPSHPLSATLQEIDKAARRSADLTRQLLAFARKQTITPMVLNLNEIVSSMLNILKRLIGEDIKLDWIPGVDLWSVRMDPSQIDQMLANLSVNARDAIAGVGKIIIKTENIVFDVAYCSQHPGSIPGEYVLLTVSDDGCGMDEETQMHLFEPFFTTKDMGQGTGLGLATVYGIVKQNEGFIDVESKVDKGTTFKIHLPRSSGKAMELKERVVAEMPISRGETVLLVEDEPGTLYMSQVMLEKLGYRVMSASTPGEALRLVETQAGMIHLLVTDVVMPEMNGLDLFKKLLSFLPKLSCLFMSGYTTKVNALRTVLEKNFHFIQKPFSIKDLSVKVRNALDQS